MSKRQAFDFVYSYRFERDPFFITFRVAKSSSTMPGRQRKITIEEVINSVSSLKAHREGKQAPKRPVLTPRSAKACLLCGVDPESLRIRDLDSFWEPNIDPVIQRMRHEAYIKLRSDQIRVVRKEREKLMGKGGGKKVSARFSGGSGLVDEQAAEDEKSTLVEMEKRRLEKIKYRQRREIEQMLEYEMKVAKIQEDQEAKLLKEQARREQAKRAELKRKKKAAAEKAAKLQAKKAQEEALELQRRALIKQQFEKDRQLAEQAKRREAALRKLAQKREIERREKAMEHKEQTEEIFVKHQHEIQRRLKDMELRDAKRKFRQQRKLKLKKREIARKQELVAKRAQEQMKQYRKLEAKKRRDFYHKQRQNHIRRERLEMEKEEEILETRRLQELNEQRRKLAFDEAEYAEAQRIQEILRKRAEQEDILKQKEDEIQRHRELNRERRALETKVKMANVERQRRADEFHRQQLDKQLRQQRERTDLMLRRKAELLKDRQRFSIAAKKRKDQLKNTMAQIRKQKKWGKARAVLEDDGNAKRKTRRRRPANHRNEEDPLPELEAVHARASSAAARLEAQRAANNDESGSFNSFTSPYDIPQNAGGFVPQQTTKQKRRTAATGKSILDEGLDMFEN